MIVIKLIFVYQIIMPDNISPKIWGPPAWKFLHLVAQSYPSNPNHNDKINMKLFITSLVQILPCESCRHNFKQHLSYYPLNDRVLESKENFTSWLFNMHNQVNAATGKPLMLHKQMRTKPINYRIIAMTCIVIAIIVLIIYTKKSG